MANWLNQLQSLLGQSSSSTSSSADQGLGKLLVPGALGGLAGLLVANKSARKLLTKYGTNALLVGGGAVAGTVLWNKYKDKIRAAHQDEPQFGAQSTPLDERTERLILALVFAAKSDCVKPAWKSRGVYSLSRQSNNRWIHNAWLPGSAMKKRRWKSIS
jgi:uncharacterized membrane protein YebE (DUF533 family)